MGNNQSLPREYSSSYDDGWSSSSVGEPSPPAKRWTADRWQKEFGSKSPAEVSSNQKMTPGLKRKRANPDSGSMKKKATKVEKKSTNPTNPSLKTPDNKRRKKSSVPQRSGRAVLSDIDTDSEPSNAKRTHSSHHHDSYDIFKESVEGTGQVRWVNKLSTLDANERRHLASSEPEVPSPCAEKSRRRASKQRKPVKASHVRPNQKKKATCKSQAAKSSTRKVEKNKNKKRKRTTPESSPEPARDDLFAGLVDAAALSDTDDDYRPESMNPSTSAKSSPEVPKRNLWAPNGSDYRMRLLDSDPLMNRRR